MQMKKFAKYKMIALMSAVSLTGPLASIRANDAIPTPELSAGEPAAEQDANKWKFTSPLIFWLPAMNGTVSAKGRSADVDLSMSQIADHTDVGFVGFFDVSNDRFGIYAQPNYMKISGDVSSDSGSASLETQLWIVETAARYSFWKWEGNHPGSLAALAGLRWWQLHNELTIQTEGGTFSGAETKSLYDPIVGLLYQQYFTPKFHVRVQGDVGGFDLGNETSRFAWQVWPLLGYDFTMPVINKQSTVFAGYRLLNSQRHEGSGADERGYHLLFHGVTVGLNVVLF